MPEQTPIQRRVTTDTRTSKASGGAAVGFLALAGAGLVAVIAILLVAFGAIPALALLLIAIPLAVAGINLVKEGRPQGTA